MDIPDSLKLELYAAHKSNSLKLFNYKGAKNAVTIILKDYKEYLNESEIKDYENDFKLYSALENVPPQKVVIREKSTIQTTKDMVGLYSLKEIHITQDGKFIVPKEDTNFTGNSNFAMDGLMPMIYIEGKHFRFDTGADSTVLYHKYYVENQQEIEQQYQLQKFCFAGAGGQKSMKDL
ncbi:MAG: hypothetical protein PVH88_12990 [Ignavibacteria bacterium]|jgi:hypothetical protein